MTVLIMITMIITTNNRIVASSETIDYDGKNFWYCHEDPEPQWVPDRVHKGLMVRARLRSLRWCFGRKA